MVSTQRDKMKRIKPVGNHVVMATNAGDRKLHEKGDWKEWGQTYLCKGAVANIVSVPDAIEKGFGVVFDLARENAFYVIDNNNIKQ